MLNLMKGRIIGRQPLPSLEEVFLEVQREESRRGVMLGKKGGNGQVENLALSSVVAANQFSTNQPRSNDKPRVWCDFCNKPRHTRETCCKLYGKPTDCKSTKNGGSNSPNHGSNSIANNAKISVVTKE